MQDWQTNKKKGLYLSQGSIHRIRSIEESSIGNALDAPVLVQPQHFLLGEKIQKDIDTHAAIAHSIRIDVIFFTNITIRNI
jgi:hypothetical protein